MNLPLLTWSPDHLALLWALSLAGWALFLYDWSPQPTRARLRFCLCLGVLSVGLGASVLGYQLIVRDRCGFAEGWGYFLLGCWL